VFSTGQGRKTDATDAHAIAVVAVRTSNLAQVAIDDELVALRLLADRRDELAGARTRTVSRLHRLLLQLLRDLTGVDFPQARRAPCPERLVDLPGTSGYMSREP
jgi:transposase